MSEFEPKPRYTISEMTADDLDGVSIMRKQAWKDTYTNPEVGVTEEWIDERFASRLAPEGHAARQTRFLDGKQAGTLNAWTARNEKGEIIGATTPYIDQDGEQRVGSLYVDKRWHGTGLGSELMQRVVDWFDPEKPIALEVVSYNDRAKAFYRKWGFEEVAGSDALFGDKIPEIRMIRQPIGKREEA